MSIMNCNDNNECELHPGKCCLNCDDRIGCPAPCEVADYQNSECSEGFDVG